MTETISTLTKRQTRTFGPRSIESYGKGHAITATARYDDECGNGHNTFAITGEIRSPRGRIEACGCLHEEITKAFPELVPLIKWHLTSSDGPMHYPANALFLASDRDCWGYRKDEQKRGKDGKLMWMRPTEAFPPSITTADEQPKGEFVYVPVLGEGKARELDAARLSAIWPEATDEELTAPGLKERLEARLPKLLEEFREAMTSAPLNFVF